MGVDQRLAAIEFLHDRQEQRIAKPLVAIARHQGDAVGLQRVERVGQLAQAAFGIGERQHREIAEPSGMIRDQLGGILVRLAAELSRRIALGEIDAGVVTDSIAVAMPALSMSASDFSMVQFFISGSPKPPSFDAVT